MTGLVAVIMIFSIPIIGMGIGYLESKNKHKRKMLEDEIELEKLRHENYLLETERLRLELAKRDRPSESMRLDKTDDPDRHRLG